MLKKFLFNESLLNRKNELNQLNKLSIFQKNTDFGEFEKYSTKFLLICNELQYKNAK